MLNRIFASQIFRCGSPFFTKCTVSRIYTDTHDKNRQDRAKRVVPNAPTVLASQSLVAGRRPGTDRHIFTRTTLFPMPRHTMSSVAASRWWRGSRTKARRLSSHLLCSCYSRWQSYGRDPCPHGRSTLIAVLWIRLTDRLSSPMMRPL